MEKVKMNPIQRIERRINPILTAHRISIILGIIFIVSLLPILYVSPYVRATGDDLGYSWTIHNAITGGSGLMGIISEVIEKMVSTWYSWQGTWSSVALFCLQPGIWGEEWYPITVLVALVCILVGTWYFLTVMFQSFGLSSSFRWIAFFLTSLLLIQYLPSVRSGIFWWTSVAHYCIPYGIVLMCMGWSLRFLKTGKFRFFLGMILGMTYLGGAGYPEIVLGAVFFALVILASLLNLISYSEPVCEQRKRSCLLFIPLILELIGFAISAASPGNVNRGGEDFGFSINKVVDTLISCVKQGLLGTVDYFVDVRPLFLILLVIAVFAWEMTGPAKKNPLPSRKSDEKGSIWQPFLFVVLSLAILCLIRTPEIYAATEVSGGIPNSYWMITMTIMTLDVTYCAVWLKRRHLAHGKKEQPEPCDSSCSTNKINNDNKKQEENTGKLQHGPFILILVCVFCLVFSRHLIGNTADYTCITFASSGALADYHEQMEEWLTLLNDPDTTNVELPAMNDDQGPFMLMVPLSESGGFTNSVYENYYGKESVICVPRE